MSKDERKNFYRTVAKGLMRPLFSVYRRVTRMYDQKNYMGKYTVEEIDLLKEWVELEWFQKLLFIILHKFQDSTTFVLDGSKPLAPDNTVGQQSELQSFDDEAVMTRYRVQFGRFATRLSNSSLCFSFSGVRFSSETSVGRMLFFSGDNMAFAISNTCTVPCVENIYKSVAYKTTQLYKIP